MTALSDRPRLPADQSSANDDPRRDNMVTAPHHTQCATCLAIVPRSNAGEIVQSDCGACYRITFLMSGLVHHTDRKLENKLLAETRNRPTKAERDKMLSEGYRWWDVTDIRNKEFWCRHHTHSLTMAPEILEYYGDTFEPYRQYTPTLIAQWFDDGSPVVDHTPVKLSNAQLPPPEESMPQIPDKYLEGYNPCSMCTHYARGIDEETGASTPHRGTCTLGARNRGVLALLANKERTTYSFLSCLHFNMEPKREFDRRERPSQLFGFAELNPMHEDPATIAQFYAYTPRAFLPAPLSQEEQEVLENTDLVTSVQSRMDEIDYVKFSKDMAHMPVARHFAKRIKENTKEENAHWSRFSHYSDIGLSLYDNAEANVTSAKELTFTIPDQPVKGAT